MKRLEWLISDQDTISEQGFLLQMDPAARLTLYLLKNDY